MTKKQQYRRTIVYSKKSKPGARGPVHYAVLIDNDRLYIGNLINTVVNATERELLLIDALFESAHLGTYKDENGHTIDKTWWDLLIGLKKKFESKMPNGVPQDFSEQQLEYLNKMLSHIGADNILFVAQELAFELSKSTLNDLFESRQST